MVSIHKFGRIARLEKARETKRKQADEASDIAAAAPGERYAYMCRTSSIAPYSSPAEISADDAERIYREIMK